MIKSILVPATGGEPDIAAFKTALAVARACAAHLDFLHVRVDAAALAAGMAAADGAGALAGGMLEHIERQSDERENKAQDAFERFCRRHRLSATSKVTAKWHREVGAEPYWIAAYGRAADLIIAGRAADDDGIMSDSLEAALLQSGRPLLIPPAAGLSALPGAVVVAWKGTAEAARAVTAAMPLIERARTVEILSVAEDGQEPDDGAERLAASLGRHRVAVRARRLPPAEGGVGETLIAAAQQRDAMLVMGGYGHSRLVERVFGGVTERVLRAASVPVLMAH